MAALSSAWDAWASPADFLEKLYTVIGAAEFDLDPCSPGRHRSRVRARSHFDEADNGLAHPWKGTIYMNPPYGREIAHWTGKALDEVASRRAKFVIGLLPARTDTAGWHRDIARHADIWFLNGRLAFGDGAQPSPFASAIIFWGATDGHRASMGTAFPRAWHVAAQRKTPNGIKQSKQRKPSRLSAGASGAGAHPDADVLVSVVARF